MADAEPPERLELVREHGSCTSMALVLAMAITASTPAVLGVEARRRCSGNGEDERNGTRYVYATREVLGNGMGELVRTWNSGRHVPGRQNAYPGRQSRVSLALAAPRARSERTYDPLRPTPTLCESEFLCIPKVPIVYIQSSVEHRCLGGHAGVFMSWVN